MREATPSGSLAAAETVIGWLAAGTAGEWIMPVQVGPALATAVEFGAEGVPPSEGRSMVVTRARRLK